MPGAVAWTRARRCLMSDGVCSTFAFQMISVLERTGGPAEAQEPACHRRHKRSATINICNASQCSATTPQCLLGCLGGQLPIPPRYHFGMVCLSCLGVLLCWSLHTKGQQVGQPASECNPCYHSNAISIVLEQPLAFPLEHASGGCLDMAQRISYERWCLLNVCIPNDSGS